jgi:hypothetical protein
MYLAVVILYCISNFLLRDCSMTTYYLDYVSPAGTTQGQLLATNTHGSGTPSIPTDTGVSSNFGNSLYTFRSKTFNNLCNGVFENGASVAGVTPGNAVDNPLPERLAINGCAYRTPNKLSGLYPSGQWRINLHMVYAISGELTSSNFRTRARIFKGTLASGANAVEITSTAMVSNTITINAPGPSGVPTVAFVDFVMSMNRQQLVLEGEYLFIQLAFNTELLQTTTSSDALVWAVYFGSGTSFTTPTIQPTYNKSEDLCGPFNAREMYTYITPDGTEYPLDVDGRRRVLTDENTGMPDIEYKTQQGPRQHGETVNGYTLKPRVVQLLIRHDYESRDAFWHGRENLLQILSPGRQLVDGNIDAGTLRKYLSTGENRDLAVRIVEGPGFKPRGLQSWDEWAYQEVIRFIAHDPIYSTPVQVSYTFDRQGSQLSFPITFPVQFSTIDHTASLYYSGTWLCYPTITFTGPMTMGFVHNTTTDEKIQIDYPLLSGETITVTLQYGAKLITKNDGTNLLGYLSEDSAIGTFHLSENALGENVIRAFAHGVNPDSQIVMSWYPRYVGV